MPQHRGKLLKWISLVFFLALVFSASKLINTYAPNVKEEIHHLLAKQHGLITPILYIVIFVCWNALFLPASILLLCALLVWDRGVALICAYLAGVSVCTAQFVFSRTFGKAYAHANLPSFFQHYQELLLDSHGFSLGFCLHFIFFLFPPVNWIFGLSEMPFSIFLLGTSLGILPGITIWIFAGNMLFQLFGGGLNQSILTSVALVCMIVGLIMMKTYLLHYWHKRIKEIKQQNQVQASTRLQETSTLISGKPYKVSSTLSEEE